MAWWGKFIGGAFGFMLGGPLGALMGAALGHQFDKGMDGLPDDGIGFDEGDKERVQAAFFTATFSVMGCVAKADGKVSKDEISLAESVMDEMELTADMRRTAINLFNEGKSPEFPLDDVVEQFRHECHRRQTLMQMFLEVQLQAAYADGVMDTAEAEVLSHICSLLGFSEFDFRRLERKVQAERHYAGGDYKREERSGSRDYRAAPTLSDAYDVLGVMESATDAEVKKAYRRQMSQHHPDKLVSKGLPEEMMKMAEQKTKEIKQAYDQIKSARGIR